MTTENTHDPAVARSSEKPDGSLAMTYAERGAQLKAAAFAVAAPETPTAMEPGSAKGRSDSAPDTDSVFHLRLQVARASDASARRGVPRYLLSRSARPGGMAYPARAEYSYALDLSHREVSGLLLQIQEGRPVRIHGGAMVSPEQITGIEVRSTVYPSGETLKMLRLLNRAKVGAAREEVSATAEPRVIAASDMELIFQSGRLRKTEELILE